MTRRSKSSFTKKRVIVLPDKLLMHIEQLKLTPKQYNRSIKVVSVLIRNAIRQNIPFTQYLEIPSTYWKATIAEHYEHAINPLVMANIIHRNDSYSTKYSYCKSYRVNPALMEGRMRRIEYEGSKRRKDNSKVCKSTRKFLQTLRLDLPAAIKTTMDYITSGAYMKKIDTDHTYGIRDRIKISNWRAVGFHSDYCSVEFAINYAESRGLALIRDKNKYYVDDFEMYCSCKEKYIELSYKDALYRFQNREYRANRNETNQRLDSNITSMPSILLKHFTFKGEPLHSIDLSNSQFAILSSRLNAGLYDIFIFPRLFNAVTLFSISIIISNPETEISSFNIQYQHLIVSQLYNTSILLYINTYMSAKMGHSRGIISMLNPVITGDICRFIELAKNGDLYEFIRDSLGFPEGEKGRQMAKELMFEVFFSSYKNTSAMKKNLKVLFPNLIAAIDRYKKSCGDNKFVIDLQKHESAIFIDKIMMQAIQGGYDVISKHDSLLCPESQVDGVKKIINDVLLEELNDYSLKVNAA